MVSLAKKPKESYLMEKWVPTGEHICPVCSFLQKLGWVAFGALPPIQQAHSHLGGEGWKAADSSCLCTKDFKRGTPTPMTFSDVEQLWFDEYASIRASKLIMNCSCSGKDSGIHPDWKASDTTGLPDYWPKNNDPK